MPRKKQTDGLSMDTFLFGNVGEDGELDETYDAETAAALRSGLTSGGLGDLINLGIEADEGSARAGKGGAVVNKAKDAVDFEDMEELAEDEGDTPEEAAAKAAKAAAAAAAPAVSVPMDDLAAAVAKAQPNFFKSSRYSVVDEYEDYDEEDSDEDEDLAPAEASQDAINRLDLSVLSGITELTPETSVICSDLNNGDPILKYSEMFAPQIRRKRTKKLTREYDEDDMEAPTPGFDEAVAFERTEEEAVMVEPPPAEVTEQEIIHVSKGGGGLESLYCEQVECHKDKEDEDVSMAEAEEEDAWNICLAKPDEEILDEMPPEGAFDGVEQLPWEEAIVWDDDPDGDDWEQMSRKKKAKKAADASAEQSGVKQSTSLNTMGTWPIPQPTSAEVAGPPLMEIASNLMDLLDEDMVEVDGTNGFDLGVTPPPNPPQPQESIVTGAPLTGTSPVQKSTPKKRTKKKKAKEKAFDFSKDYRNEELELGDWEERIAWDEDHKPPPTPLVFDMNDPLMIYEEQFIANDLEKVVGGPIRRRKIQKLEAAAAIAAAKKAAEEAAKPTTNKSRKAKETAVVMEVEEDLDPLNISLDHYYINTRASSKKQKVGKMEVFHAPVALKLSLIKPHLSREEVVHFHRPRLADAGSMPTVLSDAKKDKRKVDGRKTITSRDAFKNKNDLTARDGDVVAVEYLEPKPLVVQNVGMASKLVNYRRRSKEGGDKHLLEGETVTLEANDESPFFGDVLPGKVVRSFDNKLFRVPVAKHQPNPNDFLLVVTKDRKKMYLREMVHTFCAGQIQPQMEVYAPNSRNSAQYQKARLKTFIYRFFKRKNHKEARIRIEDMMQAFPGCSDQGCRRLLKDIADYEKGGDGGSWWTLKEGVPLPTEEELQQLLTPEQVCCYEAMLVGALRLEEVHINRTTTPAGVMTAVKNAGVKDESFLKYVRLFEEELSVSPWYLSASFVSAMAGKGMLRLAGGGEPFGKGESFSYVKIPQKEQQKKQKKRTVNIPKMSVTGTAADLRKLSLDNARIVLLKFGVSEAVIDKLPRWKRIAMVRKKSSEAAVSGADDLALTKYARGSRYSFHQAQEEYREHRQRIFDQQLRVIQSTDVDFSSDESEDEDDESDVEEFSKDLVAQLDGSFGEAGPVTPGPAASTPATPGQPSTPGEPGTPATPASPMSPASPMPSGGTKAAPTPGLRKLTGPEQWFTPNWREKWVKKVVTVPNENGTWTRKVTIIKDVTEVEKIVTLMKQTKSSAIKATVSRQSELERNRIRREKRRLQEKLRRLKKNAEKQRALKKAMIDGDTSSTPTSSTANSALTCGACGMPGHMRTNRMCPLFDEDMSPPMKKKKPRKTPVKRKRSVSASPFPPPTTPANPLVKVEGSKLKISGNVIPTTPVKEEAAVAQEAGSSKLRISLSAAQRDAIKNTPPAPLPARKKQKVSRTTYKQKSEELSALNALLEMCVLDVINLEYSVVFRAPVKRREVPDYHLVVKKPMDLGTMQKKCRNCKYNSVEEFMADFKLLVSNCHLYNETRNPHLPPTADALLAHLLAFMETKKPEIDAAVIALQQADTVTNPAVAAVLAVDEEVSDEDIDIDDDDEEFQIEGEEWHP